MTSLHPKCFLDTKVVEKLFSHLEQTKSRRVRHVGENIRTRKSTDHTAIKDALLSFNNHMIFTAVYMQVSSIILGLITDINVHFVNLILNAERVIGGVFLICE